MSTKRRIAVTLQLASVALATSGCAQQHKASGQATTSRPTAATTSGAGADYDLEHPVRSYVLPPVLREISSIATVDATTLACLQDEKGWVYLLDLATGTVKDKLRFGPKGDYEGLAITKDRWWVLRSDGLLLELRLAGREFVPVATHALDPAHHDWESVAADRGGERLLVVPKDVAKEVTKDERRERPVFGFGLEPRGFSHEPLLTLDAHRLLAAAARLDPSLPTKTSAKGKERVDAKLHFSEIAVRPDTGDLWLLSGPDRALLSVDRSGNLLAMHVFPESELPQPEALAFLADGTLAIASEGGAGSGVLRVYGPRKR